MRTAKQSRNTYPRLEARHFWFVAETLKSLKSRMNPEDWNVMARQFTYDCASNSARDVNGNKTFKEHLFQQACGLLD